MTRRFVIQISSFGLLLRTLLAAAGLYIHLVQADGNQAWSSPIWVSYQDPVP